MNYVLVTQDEKNVLSFDPKDGWIMKSATPNTLHVLGFWFATAGDAISVKRWMLRNQGTYFTVKEIGR